MSVLSGFSDYILRCLYLRCWAGCLNSEPGIASVVDKDESLSHGPVGNDPGCTVCEMAVVWAQNQLRENKTKEQIDAYLNQVLRWIL